MRNIISSLLFLALSFGSVCSQTKGIPPELLNRKWTRTVVSPPTTYIFIFKSDSTFTFTNPENSVTLSNSLIYKNVEITFPAVGCPSEGTYKFSISGNSLTFQTTVDSCKDRKDALEGLWITND